LFRFVFAVFKTGRPVGPERNNLRLGGGEKRQETDE
jgi:hypothetical protein